jgi:tRNA (guanine37-N1)-methyltransferase
VTRFTIITAFPDFFRGFLSTSIVGRGLEAGLFDVKVLDLRAFGKGAYRQIDDYAFGSGGMVLMAQPLEDALNAVRAERREGKEDLFVVYPTPQGIPLRQEIVETLFHQKHVVIVCGHYEGLDERFIEEEVGLEVSIGDCVLTGGEIPAMAIIDAVSRLIPGVVGKFEAVTEDSFYQGMLDHPHYTRPAVWRGKDVPDALISGNAAAVRKWRRKEAVTRTLSRRADLLSGMSLARYMEGGFYVAAECAADAAQVREWAELCAAYGVARLFLIAGHEKRESLRQELGGEDFRGRDAIKLTPSFSRAMDWLGEKKAGMRENRVLTVEAPDEARNGARHWLEVKRLILERYDSVLFYFGGQGGFCDVPMLPAREGGLSFFAKLAIVLDRFL